MKLRYVPILLEDIHHSLANGLGLGDEVNKSGSWKPLEEKLAKFDLKLPCSSTKHALEIVPVALTNAESGFAADTAALTAGAKIVGRYYGRLTEELGQQIYEGEEPEIILIEASLSFLGLGAQPPTPSLGTMLTTDKYS